MPETPTLNYEPYEWTDTENTPIFAEDLKHMEKGIKQVTDFVNLLISQRSHIGSIVQSTTLDTEEKVINLYGGIRWELIQGRFLLGKSDEYPIGTSGGEEKHALTTEEMPAHKHSGKTGIAETDTIRVVSLAGSRAERNHITGFGDGTYADINDVFPGQNHWHSLETNNVGSGTPHNNMPPYKTVYIWERVE